MKDKTSIAGGFVFLIFGLVFIFVGVLAHQVNTSFFETAKTTTAVIEDIETETVLKKDSRGKTKFDKEHHVYVGYVINGVNYTNISLDGYDSTMKIGDKITVYYQEDNPEDVKTKQSTSFLLILFVVLGTVAFVVGVSLVLNGFNVSGQRLKKEGICINATVTNVKMDEFNSMNGRHPYYIQCEATDPNTGQNRIFTSKSVYMDLSRYQFTTAPVYISTKKPKNYYVDLEAAIQIANSMSSVVDLRS
jgi:hypothetical protein